MMHENKEERSLRQDDYSDSNGAGSTAFEESKLGRIMAHSSLDAQ